MKVLKKIIKYLVIAFLLLLFLIIKSLYDVKTKKSHMEEVAILTLSQKIDHEALIEILKLHSFNEGNFKILVPSEKIEYSKTTLDQIVDHNYSSIFQPFGTGVIINYTNFNSKISTNFRKDILSNIHDTFYNSIVKKSESELVFRKETEFMYKIKFSSTPRVIQLFGLENSGIHDAEGIFYFSYKSYFLNSKVYTVKVISPHIETCKYIQDSFILGK